MRCASSSRLLMASFSPGLNFPRCVSLETPPPPLLQKTSLEWSVWETRQGFTYQLIMVIIMAMDRLCQRMRADNALMRFSNT